MHSIDTDGVKAVCDIVKVPVIASGDAGKSEDFKELFYKVPEISAGLAASVFHFGEIKIEELKKELAQSGINVRL